MTGTVPPLVIATVTDAGATLVRHVVPAQWLQTVMQAYSDSITEAFYPAVAISGLSIIGAAVVEWISVRGKKIDMGYL